MIQNKRILVLLLCMQFGVSACGTRDYGSVAPEPPPQVSPPKAPEGPMRSRTYHPPETGFLWRGLSWVGVRDSDLESFKTALRDDDQTDGFCAFGAAVTGGAVLGLVIRAAGSWILGGPIEVESVSPVWRRLESAAKTTSQGILRGALTGGGCYLLLTGLSPLPFVGILGPDFRGLSAAVVLAGLAAVASTPYARKAAHKDWFTANSFLGQAVRKNKVSSKIWNRVQQWSATSELAKDVRYQIAPGLMVVGVGSGVGLLVYNGCRYDDVQ